MPRTILSSLHSAMNENFSFSPGVSSRIVDQNVESNDSLGIVEHVPDPTGTLLGSSAISSEGDGRIYLWNALQGEPRWSVTLEHDGYVRGLAFSPKSKWLASLEPLKIWGVQSGEEVTGEVPSDAVVTPDEHHANVALQHERAAGLGPEETSIREEDSDTSVSLATTECETSDSDIAYERAERGTDLGSNVETNSDEPAASIGSDFLRCLVFSPKEDIYATGTDGGVVQIWKVDGKIDIYGPLLKHADGVRCLAFSPDCKTLASGSKELIVWNLEDDTRPTERLLIGHQEISCLAFESRGRILASGSYQQNVCVWDVERCERVIGPLEGHSSEVISLGFSQNGQLLASGCDDGVIIIWKVETREKMREPSDVRDSPARLRVFDDASVSMEMQFMGFNSYRDRSDDARVVNTYVEAEGSLVVADGLNSKSLDLSGDGMGIYRIHGAQEDGQPIRCSPLGHLDGPAQAFWYHRSTKKLWVQLNDDGLAILDLVE